MKASREWDVDGTEKAICPVGEDDPKGPMRV
jgi:hypothetical protein